MEGNHELLVTCHATLISALHTLAYLISCPAASGLSSMTFSVTSVRGFVMTWESSKGISAVPISCTFDLLCQCLLGHGALKPEQHTD